MGSTSVITFGNFKGGVGKTTASCLLSYCLHNKGYKTLLVDLDPQANTTGFLTTSYDVPMNDFVTVYQAMEGNNLSDCLITLEDGFDLLPSASDLIDFRNLAIRKTKGHQADMEHFFLNILLDDLKQQYDFIIIDVPPTISEFTNNALAASDYTLIIMQTEPDSLLGAINYYQYVQQINNMIEYGNFSTSTVSILGVLPYLKKKRSKIDSATLNQSLAENVPINQLVLDNHIYERERVKRFRIEGITNHDYHDKKVFKMYHNVLDELLEKVASESDK